MEQSSWRKVLQKQAYDIISHRYGLFVIVVGAILITLSAFHFGETVVEWSTEKYAAVFNSFSDNIASKSFRESLCLPVPIDVVYTWVNGTDPDLILKLRQLKMEMEVELNISSIRVSNSLDPEETAIIGISSGSKLFSYGITMSPLAVIELPVKYIEEVCVFSNCLITNTVVLDPVLPSNMTLFQLAWKYPLFKDAKKLFKVTSPVTSQNFTAVVLPEEAQVNALLNSSVIIEGHNITIKRCHITSDWQVQNSIMLKDTIIMSGFPHTLTGEELKAKLPEKHQKGIESIEVFSDRGIAVLHVPVKEDFDKILSETNFTIEGKEPTLNAANLVWDLRDFSRDEDISSSRFEDNEELRYSLRSLERFAPWVRHIYIVTNGQLPYWLNLENPRVTIITHEDIFPNKTHLPSFGSPAIESNIHRIPGLSDKFIYMNDDVMFGKEVWPDDFYTFSNGQKLYLTWPVPNCNEGCPSSWIKDGYCDKACNVSECEWDAGDCDGKNANQGGAGQWQGMGGWQADSKGFCHTGCANNWIADRYCDSSCNVRECGFDAGDCGTAQYDQLYGMMLLQNQTTYKAPIGETMCYFNLTSLLGEGGQVKEAHFTDKTVVRTVAVSKKFRVLTVVLHPDHNETQLEFEIITEEGNQTHEMNFTLIVNTMPATNETALVVVKNFTLGVNKSVETNKTEKLEVIEFQEIPPEMRKPKPKPADVELSLDQSPPMPANMSDPEYPEALRKSFIALELELKRGDLLEQGFLRRKKALWRYYAKHMNTSRHQKDQKPAVKPGEHASPQKETTNTNNTDPVERRTGRKLLTADNEDTEEFQMIEKDQGIQIDELKPDGGMLLTGVFPWERKGSFKEILKEKDQAVIRKQFETPEFRSRRTMDTFGDSLRHVNKLFNKAFGYQARKVPGHMPHMIDRHIMQELQDRFPKEWEDTSSHKVRSSTDMQYAFSYFYYLMGVMEEVTPEHVFDTMDTDKSKVLSDREIRTLATRLYELPLDLPTLTKLEFSFVNCSKNLSSEEVRQPEVTEFEVYYEKEMPQVTRNLFIKCPIVQKLIKDHFKPHSRYKYTTADDHEIAFKMIKTNVSSVVGQLDDVRKNPKKFICLNDNIDHTQEQAKTVKAILHDFYESILPIPSQFELPREYRNRFTHIDELREWRSYRDWLKFWTHVALFVLVLFTVASFFADRIEAAKRRLGRRRPNGDQAGDSPGEGRGMVETV